MYVNMAGHHYPGLYKGAALVDGKLGRQVYSACKADNAANCQTTIVLMTMYLCMMMSSLATMVSWMTINLLMMIKSTITT